MIQLIFIVLSIALFEALAQSSIQYARMYMKPIGILAGMFCYAAVAMLLYAAYKYRKLGIVNALWSSLSIVMMLAIGYFFFQEKLSILDKVGVVFILIGVIVINIASYLESKSQ
jgi:multidrug transporter EmrE-like cation transporter